MTQLEAADFVTLLRSSFSALEVRGAASIINHKVLQLCLCHDIKTVGTP